MENGQIPPWKKSRLFGLGDEDEEGDLRFPTLSPFQLIQHPPTPRESMEFLARSWSLSAEEITKALASKQKHPLQEKNLSPILEEINSPPQAEDKVTHTAHSWRMGAFGKLFHHKESGHGWFHHKESTHGSVKKKDRARAENAHIYAAVSVARLAAALAAVAAAENSNSGSKMSQAVASATELLASHCIEIAEQTGADHDHTASVVRSAVDIKTPGDLMTLTAAAATALRGEAALRARLPKEARRIAAISPYDRSVSEVHNVHDDLFHSETEDQKPPCVGELLLHSGKGALRWKHVSVYINKKCQVMIKLESKHVGGAFSKKDKCLVFGVCEQIAVWPSTKKEGDDVEAYFGLKTGQGFLEFKCKSKILKQQWVDGIRSLLHKVGSSAGVENSLEFMNINGSS
ncbi:hypothetical protein Ancab_033268 [Ancistrocladus abbreviatus]